MIRQPFDARQWHVPCVSSLGIRHIPGSSRGSLLQLQYTLKIGRSRRGSHQIAQPRWWPTRLSKHPRLRGNVSDGSKCEKLAVSITSPVLTSLPTCERTSIAALAPSAQCDRDVA